MRNTLDIGVIGDAVAVHNQIQLAWLAERGHRVRLLTDRPREIEGVEVIPIAWPPGTKTLRRHITAMRDIRKAFRDDEPNLIQVHMPNPYGYWALAYPFHPISVSIWGDDVLTDPYRSRILKFLIKRSLRSADMLWTDATELVAATKLLTKKIVPIHVLQWGVDFDKDLAHLPPKEERKRFVLEGSPVILGFRRLIDRLRPLDIINAFSVINQHLPEARLIMAGSGDLENAAQKRVRELGLDDAVEFTGWVDLPKLLSLMARSHLALTVPPSDGTPHSLLLAMAVPCAVVASDIPANREWIADDNGGRLVAAGDITGLAYACLKLLDDREKLWEHALRNERIVRERADRNHHFEELERLYYAMVQR